ncbi:polyribonucleotide nucleotidyltransferase [Fidelibacter multiformis]|uniref:polyribonucleotide nucleotidyltransferase n=1 Tax=Fidelibacter multiformis TaxID=3377529 RepID=UPI0037DC464E
MLIVKEREFQGIKTSLQTGKVAKQAHGSVLAKAGETVVLATVVSQKEVREGADFIPLMVEYREKFYASGKIPGGFIKREGRPSDREILSARIVDRQIRPLLPKTWFFETQVVINVLSYDQVNQADVLAAVAASAALTISDIPFAGPVASVRVGRVDGKYIINPTLEEIEKGDMDLFVAGLKDSVIMVEGESKEIGEKDFLEAIRVAQEAINELIELQLELAEEIKPVKREAPVFDELENLKQVVREKITTEIDELISILPKQERVNFEQELVKKITGELEEEYPDCKNVVAGEIHDLIKDKIRKKILKEGIRIDGRKTDEIRSITSEIAFLPRAHGSALFTRGETQALVVTTLGSKQDVQILDNIDGEGEKHYMLQYNFPPFCTGEAKMIRGTSRREIGHGNLAERALKNVVPSHEEFPYTIRVVSDILESNGSSSMATVCGGCLSLMDAGVPVKKMVSGIAMGLITEGEDFAVLSDILGEEDHYGDMDFKVAGTDDGITAIQMDLKIQGLSYEKMEKALLQAREGRKYILNKMRETITEPKKELSVWAPRITTLHIPIDKIGAVIGPGGKVIREIIADTGVEIDIEDDGTVNIFTHDSKASDEAEKRILALVEEPEVGKVYKDATVTRLMDFGAFVEFMPGKEGLVHISELKWERVEKVSDVLNVGDKTDVILFEIDRQGRMNLSIKRLSEPPERYRHYDRDKKSHDSKPGQHRRNDRNKNH